jgi:2-keto-4-pentenoate hydratase
MRVAEPEFAFRMKTDLPPRAAPYGVQEVLEAAGTLHPAIEIPDSRFADFVGAGAAQIIADNACGHRFVLGAAATSNWRALDLVEERPVITMRGKQFIGHGKNVLGDPRIALAWCANELRQLGLTLRAGDVVTTGTCHPPLPIQAGDLVAADFGSLGSVSVAFN